VASWPTGIETIKALLASNSLQKVSPSKDAATAYLAAAAKHLDSGLLVAAFDADGAYTLLYDAARKSLAAVLQAQGLRSTSKGGHYAIQEAIAAQFTKPPPRDAFRSFGRLRRARNQIEYDDISSITAEDVRADAEVVRSLHAMAVQLVNVLPVFVD
jgi:YD repeat-containing protein